MCFRTLLAKSLSSVRAMVHAHNGTTIMYVCKAGASGPKAGHHRTIALRAHAGTPVGVRQKAPRPASDWGLWPLGHSPPLPTCAPLPREGRTRARLGGTVEVLMALQICCGLWCPPLFGQSSPCTTIGKL